MNSQNLTLTIVDRKKRANTTKIKKRILSVSVSIALIILYLPNIKIGSVDPFVLKALMILIVAISIPFGLAFAFKVPGKGKITFLNDSILLQIGKTKAIIQLGEESQITFYSFKKFENDSKYFIEIKAKDKTLLFELDVIFTKEKAALENIKNLWRQQNINFIEKNMAPSI